MKKIRKRSVVWGFSREDFQKIVFESKTLSDISLKVGLKVKGDNLTTIKRRMREDNIDSSHIVRGLNSNKGRKFPGRKIPLEEVMVTNSSYGRGHLKRRLIEGKIIEYKCECGNEGFWNGKPLSLQLDHKNGIDNDHRKENLRFLCPNCHSQTEFFTGRNKKY